METQITEHAELTLETIAYCGGLDYRDEDSHHLHKHPDHFTAECAECSSRLAFARRVAALSSSQERWRPIVSAPKDREVLVFDEGAIVIALWVEEIEAWWDNGPMSPAPTHWMPLPDPPSPEGETT